MTFLELVPDDGPAVRHHPRRQPTTVTGQADRLKQIVDYVSEAYIDIQNAHRMWRWMQSEFIGQTVVGTRIMPAPALPTSGQARRSPGFRSGGSRATAPTWACRLYLTSTGAAEEGPLRWLDWDSFYETQLRGVQTPGKPQFYSVDQRRPADRLADPGRRLHAARQVPQKRADSGRRRRHSGNADRLPHHHQGRGAVLRRGLRRGAAHSDLPAAACCPTGRCWKRTSFRKVTWGAPLA